ncbi:MAG: FAD-dependent oxidoreductase [Desulfobacterales bacterium]|nr:FAD-dependent oxidoreductase [Desulfobacterales bacterium]
MTTAQASSDHISLLISRSKISTEINKTGSWCFVRPGYQDRTAPCSAACPVGEDIGRIEMLAVQGLFKKALETILQENPFPAVCGRVCFHPCEGACNRGEFDEPISINKLERFLGDIAFLDGFGPSILNLPNNGKKIAIVGAGPAGLAAAYFLTRLGYVCDVFEAADAPGGLLRWGIPSYRLPSDILENEIQRIQNLGVRIHCGEKLSEDFLIEAKERYQAVFLGCGHGRSTGMNIAGEQMAVDGLKFLYRIRNGEKLPMQGTIAVIGGGNSAIDIARSLIRLGAKPIIVYRRRKQDMPAFEHEIKMALEEGVQIQELLSPVRIDQDGSDYILSLQEMKVGEQDADGRARVVPKDSKTQSLRVNQVFSAIGAEPDEVWKVPPEKIPEILTLSHCTITQQDLPIVFGGDLTNSNKSVTDAVASGKQAAMALDTLFQKGWENINDRLSECRVGNSPALSMEIYMGGDRKNRSRHIVAYNEVNIDYFQPCNRVVSLSVPLQKSICSFDEIDHTLSTTGAMSEAQRCFNCGICNGCDNCRLFCPEVAVTLEDNKRQINFDYCKGCGICVVECPRSAMVIEEKKV